MSRCSTSGHRAIVIGSGFGGLAAAVRLGARGWNVTVLESPGAGTHPGTGLPGVLSSARVLDGLVPDAA